MIEVSAYLNIAGLLFDILGVVLVFLFALPPGQISKDQAVVEYPGGSHQAKIIYLSVYQWRARVGIGLLIFGFGLQALGNSVVFW